MSYLLSYDENLNISSAEMIFFSIFSLSSVESKSLAFFLYSSVLFSIISDIFLGISWKTSTMVFDLSLIFNFLSLILMS